MPREAPVTKATWPSNLGILILKKCLGLGAFGSS
jgi:hypothetical protein